MEDKIDGVIYTWRAGLRGHYVSYLNRSNCQTNITHCIVKSLVQQYAYWHIKDISFFVAEIELSSYLIEKCLIISDITQPVAMI